MFTVIVKAGIAATDLKTLMEAADIPHVFPNDNDRCAGLIIQIDPEATGTVDVLSEDETAGITLSPITEPASISYKDFNVSNTYLLASEADVVVKVMVEQKGG